MLWIDAICINQQDEQEKPQQVRIMSDIYRTGSQTLIWVGEEADASGALFSHVRSHLESAYGHSKESMLDDIRMKPYPQDLMLALDAFCRRPWFTRTWVVQESCLGQSAMVICGKDSARLKDLANACIPKSESHNFHPLRGRDGPTQLYNVDSLKPPCQISEVANVVRHCTSTDPQDKIYGILGLFSEPLVDVDYAADTRDVYRLFTQAVIEKLRNLEALHWLGTQRHIPGLASWVPDWSISRPVGTLPRALGFNGGFDGYPEGFPIKCLPDTRFLNNDLIIRGKYFDRLLTIGQELRDELPGSKDFRKIFKQWAQILQNAREESHRQTSHFARTIRGVDSYRRGRFETTDFALWYLVHVSGHTDGLHDSFVRDAESMVLEMAVVFAKRSVEEMQEAIEKFANAIETVCYGRRFCTTMHGSVALVPPQARGKRLASLLPGRDICVCRSAARGDWHGGVGWRLSA